MDLGPGVWNFSDTQLSLFTQQTCSQRLRSLAVAAGRDLRIHLGAPVATRPQSEWAGTWAGVAMVSDVPSQQVQLPYGDEYKCGRMFTTCHFFSTVAVLNTVIYGYPCGLTWPKARTLTGSLLQLVTTEIVLGGRRPRIVGGDFNAASDDLPCFALLRQVGWMSAQDLACQAHGTRSCLAQPRSIGALSFCGCWRRLCGTFHSYCGSGSSFGQLPYPYLVIAFTDPMG